MHRRVVRWHAFVVLRRVAGVRGVGWRETSSESAANDVNDQQHTEQRQYRDQSDRYRAPAFACRMMSAGRTVSFRRRNWTDWTTSSRLRGQRIVASYRANSLFAAELPSGLAGARGTRVLMPSRSFRMRSVKMVHAGSTTATHRTAAFVRLVTKGASFPASEQRRATRRVWFPAFAERAVVFVHHQSPFAVQVALYFGTNLLPLVVRRHGVGDRLLEGFHVLASAHGASIFVLRDLAVDVATRRFRANLAVVGSRTLRHRRVVVLGFVATAHRAIIFVRGVTTLAR